MTVRFAHWPESRYLPFSPRSYGADVSGTMPDGESVKVRAADLQSCRASGLMLTPSPPGRVKRHQAAFSISDTMNP